MDTQATDSHATGHEYVLSGIARRASDAGRIVAISTENLDDLLASVVLPASPQDILDRALIYVADRAPFFSAAVDIDPEKDYPVTFAKDPQDLRYSLGDGAVLDYLSQSGHHIRLTAKGWERVNELRSQRPDSNQAFVAMWFDSSLDHVWKDGFRVALTETGYKPLRISEKEFNDKIDDQIIAEIRRSGLLIADFTGHRGGVYFEAGFAMGLAIPVIWTCHQDDIGKAHFDTRQYNHIVWSDATDLKTRLTNRILATQTDRFQASQQPSQQS